MRVGWLGALVATGRFHRGGVRSVHFCVHVHGCVQAVADNAPERVHVYNAKSTMQNHLVSHLARTQTACMRPRA